MIKDKEGKVLNFGDKVEYTDYYCSEIKYQFTIEEINSDGWIWGSDLPDEYKDDGFGGKNFHNSNVCYRVSHQPWGNSRIEFRFI